MKNNFQHENQKVILVADTSECALSLEDHLCLINERFKKKDLTFDVMDNMSVIDNFEE